MSSLKYILERHDGIKFARLYQYTSLIRGNSIKLSVKIDQIDGLQTRHQQDLYV